MYGRLSEVPLEAGIAGAVGGGREGRPRQWRILSYCVGRMDSASQVRRSGKKARLLDLFRTGFECSRSANA